MRPSLQFSLSSNIPVSPPGHCWRLGPAHSSLWGAGPFCVCVYVEQHLWSPPARCQWHLPLPPVIAHTVTRTWWVSTVVVGGMPSLENHWHLLIHSFPGGASGKESTCQCRKHTETWVWFLGLEHPLEEGMAIHSSILAWKITQTEETGRLGTAELDTTKHIYTHTQHHKQKLILSILNTYIWKTKL